MNVDPLADACLNELEAALAHGPRQWTREPSQLVDDGVLAVRVNVLGQTDDVAHVEIELDMGAVDGTTRSVVDYSAGAGPTIEEQAARAVERWAATTGPVLFELLEQDGGFATNRYSTDPRGLHGWHTIEGPLIAKGGEVDVRALRNWVEANPLLPLLEQDILPAIAGLALPSIRVVFGGNGSDDLAEVSIDGTPDREVSARLASLDWPRPTGVCVANLFVLGVHDATD